MAAACAGPLCCRCPPAPASRRGSRSTRLPPSGGRPHSAAWRAGGTRRTAATSASPSASIASIA
eukprot:635879-Pleurochrysis_carterae.AAC.1